MNVDPIDVPTPDSNGEPPPVPFPGEPDLPGRVAMTDAQRAELAAYQSFVDALGVSEMNDSEFDRYLTLLYLKKAEVAS